jgi:hypothetical protein
MARNEARGYFAYMRRLSVIFVLCSALLAPAAVLAATRAVGDGSLVVRNGSSLANVPVVALTITGSVIGHVDHGRIVIDGGANNPDSARTPQITGAERCVTRDGETAQRCSGDNFSFRAVGGHYTVLLFGTGVNIVAVGSGSVRMAGLPDIPVGDGRYSLNGADFLSLPGTQTDRLTISSNG